MTSHIATAQLPPLTLDYLKDCNTLANDLPAPLSPISGLSIYVELVKKDARKRKAVDNDQSERTAKAVKSETPNLDNADVDRPKVKQEERTFDTRPFSPEQLRSMQERRAGPSRLTSIRADRAGRGERSAREQKRQGEANLALTSITSQETGALELADSVVLFVFSFWCRGVRRHQQRASRSGELESWLSTAAFVETARKAARQHGRLFAPVVAVLDLVEGMILEHACVIQRGQLRERIGAPTERRDATPSIGAGAGASAGPSDAHTPSSVNSAHSPPNATFRPEVAAEQLKSFMRWSNDAERALRLRSDALGGPLSSPEIYTHLPQTWSRIISSPPMPLPARLELGDDLHFAWPLDLNVGQFAFGHLCLFARSVLTEVAAKRGLGWRGVVLRVV